MSSPISIRPVDCQLYFIPVQTRVPLKFGKETLTSVTCARVKLTVATSDGRRVEGWGETPLSVQWVWPGAARYELRHEALKSFCKLLAEAWSSFEGQGHALEIGHQFLEGKLHSLAKEFNSKHGPWDGEILPELAALVCCSAFDIALHDACGKALGIPVYQTYLSPWLSSDLSSMLEPAQGSAVNFKGKFPCDYFVQPSQKLPVWHLVGGLDPLEPSELKGDEPKDGHPILLRDWIRRDGLKCLKIKLRGNDAEWDYKRMVDVGRIAVEEGVDWLTTDFNCTVTDPAYVNSLMDQLRDEHPRYYGMILYVEQPFPYDLNTNRIDVHSVSARKPLFMDESAHDWKVVRLGRELGWTGVALKTCKTQTGAILSACWAKAHGMTLMVQDLTNPMLAMLPHVQLAAHVGTIMGVECNAMQYYPEASAAEAKVHPGLYQRRNGVLDLGTIRGAGFGCRLEEIRRDLPPKNWAT
jgi:L-alanine-DL-glutamate epimerase-like enolase superfamily enzyme